MTIAFGANVNQNLVRCICYSIEILSDANILK
jgi:hypothetical protein